MDQITFNLLVGTLLRSAIMLGAGWLVAHGMLPQGNTEEWVGAAALVALGLAWSLYQKMVARARLHAAMALPAGATLEQVDAKIERTKALASVAKALLPFLVASSLLTGCAAKTYPTMPPADQKMVDATEVAKRITRLMDATIEAEAAKSIQTDAARIVIRWCVEGLKVIAQVPAGYGPMLAQGWKALKADPQIKPLLLGNQYLSTAATLIDLALIMWTPKEPEAVCWPYFSPSLATS